MPWALLLDARVLLGIALAATGLYAAVQRLEKERVKAEYAQFRADVETEAAKAKVRNAQEAARQAQNAQEVLSDLQSRYAALNARYRVLRANASSRPVPALSEAAPILSACPGEPSQSDASARFLGEVESRVTAILEKGDGEIAKYVQLWKQQEKNSANPL